MDPPVFAACAALVLLQCEFVLICSFPYYSHLNDILRWMNKQIGFKQVTPPYACGVGGIVHPGIDAVLTYFLKKSTVWRPFDLELPNFGQVITSHMASFFGFDL